MVLPAAAIGIICGVCAILFTILNLKVGGQDLAAAPACAALAAGPCLLCPAGVAGIDARSAVHP